MKAYIRYEGIQRIDQFLFPPEALREAVTNAIVHKDYASANPIQISVYEDKIIIWNSAQIPDELPLERLLGKHPSIPYNPLLASTFFRAGYIEAWGRGIEKIRAECRQAHAEEPEIKYAFGGVMVTFTGKPPEENTKTRNTETGINGLVEGLVETQKKILSLIEQNPGISKQEMAKNIGISTTALDKNISTLKNKGYIQRVGPDKGGYWKIFELKSEK